MVKSIAHGGSSDAQAGLIPTIGRSGESLSYTDSVHTAEVDVCRVFSSDRSGQYPGVTDERDPTPPGAPERSHTPSGRRSPAPPPTCAGLRAQTEYYQRILDLEIQARARLAADGWPYAPLLEHEVREPMDADADYESLDDLERSGRWFDDADDVVSR